MRRTAVIASIAGLALATLTACGGSSSSSSSTLATSAAPPSSAAASSGAESAAASPEAYDACGILSNEEMAGVIGNDPGTGVPGQGTCRYDDGPATLSFVPNDSFDSLVGKIADLYGPDQKSDLTGVGDRAVVFTSDDGAATVIVLGSGLTVMVQAASQDKAAALNSLLMQHLEAGQKLLATATPQ
jgi:hypothetical protein